MRRSFATLLGLAVIGSACGLAGMKGGGDESEGGSSGTGVTSGGGSETGVTGSSGGEGSTGAVCGDGVLDPGEACDDGNAVAGDGCEPGCVLTVVAPFERKFVGVMPRAVDVAPGGWIVVGGSQVAPTIAPWLARLSLAGDEVWIATPADPEIGSSVLALAVDGGGVVHAAGGTTYDDVTGEAWAARLTADGVVVDSSAFKIGDYTRAQGVALGPSPAWYVGGEAGTYSAWVRRFDAAGQVEWTWAQADASAYELVVDAAGNAFAAGVEYGAKGAVWKIDAGGQTLWKRVQATYWLFLAVDETGALYVAGSEDDEAELRLWVAKLSADGDEVWRTEVAAIAGASASDDAGGLALASTGTVFFATQALWEGSRIFGLDREDGALTWSASEPVWRWEDVAALPSGDPVVVGWDQAGPGATGVVRVYDAP